MSIGMQLASAASSCGSSAALARCRSLPGAGPACMAWLPTRAGSSSSAVKGGGHMLSATYERLGSVVNTGLQTLAVIAAGWGVSRCQLLQQACSDSQAVSLLNVLVMRVCLPALQLQLLAIYSDMRHMQNWRILAAFMLWTAVIQGACGLWVVLFEGGRMERWGVHALVLAANNTGILAPVVLEAAVGPGYGYIGMLATVCLYFQQLPVSEALMAMGRAEAEAAAAEQQMYHHQQQQQQDEKSESMSATKAAGIVHHHHGAVGGPDRAPLLAVDVRGGGGGGGEWEEEVGSGGGRTWLDGGGDGGGGGVAPGESMAGSVQGRGTVERLHQGHGTGVRGQGAAAQAVSWAVLAKNPLVWTTGVATLLSMAGSSDVLAPGSPLAPPWLGFVAGTLDWLARCSVPLTLLSTGLWMQGRKHVLSELPTVAAYLVLKLFVLPWLMLGITFVMGIEGKYQLALLLLTVVPVGQTAFVISERYQCGTQAVTATLVAGLLVMLPHLLLVLWVAGMLLPSLSPTGDAALPAGAATLLQ